MRSDGGAEDTFGSGDDVSGVSKTLKAEASAFSGGGGSPRRDDSHIEGRRLELCDEGVERSELDRSQVDGVPELMEMRDGSSLGASDGELKLHHVEM